jgi:hypothetical protein
MVAWSQSAEINMPKVQYRQEEVKGKSLVEVEEDQVEHSHHCTWNWEHQKDWVAQTNCRLGGAKNCLVQV